MSNTLHILKRFEKNTDAYATNAGFFYQYLITLDNWLENYLNNSDVNIYCEVEDDIKIEDLANQSIVFKQVKAYSSSFDIGSDEIKKSVVNFFLLYEKYKDKTVQFIYETNTKLDGRFFDLSSKAALIQSEKDECIKAISDLLEDKFKEKNDKDLEKIQKEIKDAQDFIDDRPTPKKNQIQPIEDRKQIIRTKKIEEQKIIDEFNDLKTFIANEASEFIDRIVWKTTETEREEEIKKLKESILNKIKSIDEFKPIYLFAYGRLFEIVSDKSQQETPGNRVLNKTKLLEVTNEAINVEEFKKMQFNESTNVFLNSIDDSLAIITEKLEQFDYIPSFNSFQDYSDKIFDILNTTDLFDDKVINVIQTVVPDDVLNKFKNQLFFPVENQKTIDDIKVDLSKDKVRNEGLWKGWLRFLVFINTIKEQDINLENFKIELEIELKKLFGRFSLKKEIIPADLKFIFVTSENFLKIATQYVRANKHLITKNECFVLNTHCSHFSNTHFTNAHKSNIIKDISTGASITIANPRDFGIINFKTLLDEIVDSRNINDFQLRFKKILEDAITGK